MATRNSAARQRLWGSVTAVALAAALPAPAIAQDTQDSGFTMLGRMIFGWGTPKVAIDTPQAVTVVEQEDLDREQPRAIGDLFANVPGVQAAGASARALGQAFNIRGIGNAEQAGSQNRIIVTVDGAVKFFEQYRTGSFFGDPELYKRVEVLRGPASSTMYGTGAIGGVVNFTTKDAADFLPEGASTTVKGKLSYDSNGGGKIGSLTFAQKFGENADVLASITRGTSGTKQDGAGVDLAGTESERWSGLLKGNYYFGTQNDQRLTLSLSRTDSDLEDAAVAQTGGAVASFFGTADLHAIDDTATLTYAHEGAGTPWLDLTAQLSYSKTSTERSDFSLGFYCMPGRFAVLCDNEVYYETLSAKLENTIEFSQGAWENYLTLGAQVSSQDRYAMSSVGALGFHPGGTEKKAGVYLQGEFIWNDRLTITPGMRFDHVRQTPDADALANGGDTVTDTASSASIAAIYKLNDSVSVFGSLARTERMPTLDELYSSDGVGAAGRTPSLSLDKEKARTIELGLAYNGRDVWATGDSLTAKATLFHNDMKDLIAANASGSADVPYFYNVDRAEIWGAELEAAYEAERWFAQLAYSNVKSRDKSTDLTLADTPAQNIALTLGAKFPVQGVRAGWRVQAYDDITTSSSTTSGDGYVLHDVFVSWQPQEGTWKGVELGLTVENLFDKEYRNNLSLDNGLGRNVKVTLAKAVSW
ncbi:TonB-dependent receptor domain-containing protein [Thalassobius sp. S69A]|uniref:TonB-dependent receptor domain-containing protein n=1 Tax=unclassified Thalassovita TaxID=2619711 RepID=UPI000C100C3D|nr:hemin receptor protein HmuR [Paracoccaceae bacterium]MBT26450.1 hemin receptor protein HmuR [Paracoccaceae bacterium]